MDRGDLQAWSAVVHWSSIQRWMGSTLIVLSLDMHSMLSTVELDTILQACATNLMITISKSKVAES